MEKYFYKVLTIAGSDSGGGAGIQADLKTFSALGCYGMSVITAITAQNTLGVKSIHPVPISFIKDQADAVLSDIGVDAVKIGMLFSADVVDVVKSIVLDYNLKNIVFDPVMISVNKDLLIENSTIQKIINEFLTIVDIVTPNIYEAEIILSVKISKLQDMIDSTKMLIDKGCNSVLLKGGRICDDECFDVFYSINLEKPLIFSKKTIKTLNIHGTGCTLSSAIASYLALGYQVSTAINLALEYTYKAIDSGSNAILGKGRGPVNHFFNPVPTKFKYKN